MSGGGTILRFFLNSTCGMDLAGAASVDVAVEAGAGNRLGDAVV
jgi:hypothetical protein